MPRLIPIAAVVAVLLALGGAAFWAYGQADDGAEAETQVIRWVNVTVEVPADPNVRPGPVPAPPALLTPADLLVSRDFGPDGPVLAISSLERRGSGVGIDAETGKIIKDQVQPEDRAAIDDLLATLKVSPWDPAKLPWPYSGQPPSVSPERIGNITLIPPDPAAGIIITYGVGDPGGEFIEVNNGRSLVFIRTNTGRIAWEPAFLVSADKPVLERFLATVELTGP